MKAAGLGEGSGEREGCTRVEVVHAFLREGRGQLSWQKTLETPSWKLGSSGSCLPPAETKPVSLEGNPHSLLSEICSLWNVMTYLVLYNHFLPEEDSS